VDIPQGAISSDAWNLVLYPDTDPYLAYKEGVQLNPYFQIFILNRVYLPARQSKIPAYTQQFQFALQTIFNTKTFYSQ
jgi:hypothetical protein